MNPPSSSPSSSSSSSFLLPNPFNAALPYAALVENEADQSLNDILLGIRNAVLARELKPALTFWTRKLQDYLDVYKIRLTKEQYIALVHLYYSLLAQSQTTDFAIQELAARLLTRLLRKQHLVAPQDLVLDWRPLYELLSAVYFKKHSLPLYVRRDRHGAAVMELVRCARDFFAPQATQEIMDELFPMLTPHDQSFLNAVGLLSNFLPTNHVVERRLLDQSAGPGLPRHPVSPRIVPWVGELMDTWRWAEGMVDADYLFLSLFSRLATSSIGLLDWSEYADLLFTKFLRWLDLPVGSQSLPNPYRAGFPGANASLFFPSEDRVESFAQIVATFIVSTMHPGGFAIDRLQALVQSIHSFYHPSNNGAWSGKLARFLDALTSAVTLRYGSENPSSLLMASLRSEEAGAAAPTSTTTRASLQFSDTLVVSVPEFARLDASTITKFVQIVKPVALLSLFAKSPATVTMAVMTIKSLAYLAPSDVFPDLLARIYPALETLTETHQTTASLACLTAVARPLLWRAVYPEGAYHLPALLQLSLPGIDLNDFLKTETTLRFYLSVLTVVPIFNYSPLADAFTDEPDGDADRPKQSGPSSVSAETDSSPFYTRLPLRESDRQLCLDTAALESWVVQFLDKIFAICEDLLEPSKSKAFNLEANVGKSIVATCHALFQQLSPPLLELAINKVFQFTSTHLRMNSLKLVGQLCAALSFASPARVLDRFLPFFTSKVELILLHDEPSTHQSSPTASSQHEVDDQALWSLRILGQVVKQSGGAVLGHKDDLLRLLRLCFGRLHLYGRKLVKAAGKVLKNTLKSLSLIYLTETRSTVSPLFAGSGAAAASAKDDFETPDVPSSLEMSLGSLSSPSGSSATTTTITTTPGGGNTSVLLQLRSLFDSWGAPVTLATAKPQWHTPSQPETEFALQLLDEFLSAVVQQFEVSLAGRNAASFEFKHHLLANLNIFYAIITGSAGLLPSVDGPLVQLENTASPSLVPMKLSHPIVYSQYTAETLRAGSTWRTSVGELLHRLFEAFLSTQQDDTKLLRLLVKCTSVYLCNRGLSHSRLPAAVSYYKTIRHLLGSSIHGESARKKFKTLAAWHAPASSALHAALVAADAWERPRARITLLFRLNFQHQVRVIKSTQGSAYTQLSAALIRDLFSASIHAYEQVRKRAQTGLSQALFTFTRAKYDIFPRVIAILQNASAGSTIEQVKGALYVLQQGKINKMCLSDYKSINTLLSTLLHCQPIERPSVQALVAKVFMFFSVDFVLLPLDSTITESSLQAATALLARSDPLGDSLKESGARAEQERNASARVSYFALVDSLMNILRPPLVAGPSAPSTASDAGRPHLHWRYESFYGTAIVFLLRRDVPPEPRVVDWIVNGCVNDNYIMRKICLKALSSVLSGLEQYTELSYEKVIQTAPGYEAIAERRYKNPALVLEKARKRVTVQVRDEAAFSSRPDTPFGERPDNRQFVYHQDSMPRTEEQWRAALFMDRNFCGWRQFPQAFPSYRYVAKGAPRQLHPSEMPVVNAFFGGALSPADTGAQTTLFLDRFIKFIEMEQTPPSSSGRGGGRDNADGSSSAAGNVAGGRNAADAFSEIHAKVFKQLLRMYGLPAFHRLKGFLKTFSQSHEQSTQRAATEIIAGAIRGSKHWDFESRLQLWEDIRAVLSSSMEFVGNHTIDDWIACLRFCSYDQDPKRYYYLIEFVLNGVLENSQSVLSSYSEYRTLQFCETLLEELSWRAWEPFAQIVNHLSTLIRHPYKLIREKLGSLLNTSIRSMWIPNRPSLPPAASALSPVAADLYATHVLPFIELCTSTLKSWKVPVATGATEKDKEGGSVSIALSADEQSTLNGCRTVLCWLLTANQAFHGKYTAPFLPEMVPYMFSMFDVTDEELKQLSRSAVFVVSQLVLPPPTVAAIIDRVFTWTQESRWQSWHGKVNALLCLQVMVFRNLFLVSGDSMKKIVTIINMLLKDEQIEVRNMASVFLSGLIRCDARMEHSGLLPVDQVLFSPNTRDENRVSHGNFAAGINKIDHDLTLTWRIVVTVNRWKTYTLWSRTALPSVKQQHSDELRAKLASRHAGVLGMCAFVQAFPYDVPAWMPTVLVELGAHMQDHVVIQTTVKKTLLDFWRTHQDNWTHFKTLFSEDELYVITDLLISPSYYA